MNEYEMSILAEAHRKDLRAEADRARLARVARQGRAARSPQRPGRQRGILRLDLRALLGRPA